MPDTQLRISPEEGEWSASESESGGWFRVMVGTRKPWCKKCKEAQTFKNPDGLIVNVPSGWYVFRSNGGKKPFYTICSPSMFNRDVQVLDK